MNPEYELPEILETDAIAQETLEIRRQLLRPHRPGWWRGYPNPHSVPDDPEDDDDL